MTSFEVVNFGANNADETINFGSYSNLYEITNVALLKPAQKLPVANVNVNAIQKQGKVFSYIYKTVRITTKEFDTIIFEATFNHCIANICVSEDCSYLLICLNGGQLHIVHFQSEEQLCNKFDLELAEGSEVINSFAGGSKFVVVTNTASIYEVEVENKENELKLSCNLLHNLSLKLKKITFNYPQLFLTTANEMVLINLKTRQVTRGLLESELKYVHPYARSFLALDVDGNLLKISPLTLAILQINNLVKFSEFLVITEKENRAILTVTQPDEENLCYIQLYLSLELNEIFSIKLKHPTCLIQCDSLTEEILVLYKIFEDNLLHALQFGMVFETEPEKRLERLVLKHKFEEAEIFAKTYNINREIIAMTKAKCILDKYTCTSQDVDELLLNFDSIKDDIVFKLNGCHMIVGFLPEVKDVRRILDYGLQLAENDDDFGSIFLNMSFKFETFMMINEDFDMYKWTKFNEANLIDELKRHLENHKIDEAITIYTRLDQSAIGSLSVEAIEDVLRLVENMRLNVYEPFMPTLIQVSLRYVPESLPLFIKWLLNIVSQFEKNEAIQFPENAIAFSNRIIMLISNFNRNKPISWQKEIAAITNALASLQVLKNNYNISLSMKDYLKGPHNVIRILLNVNLAPTEYLNFVPKYLLTYIQENMLDHNTIFLGEIKNLMLYTEKYWLPLIETILNCINNTDIKLEAVCFILKSESTSVPYCDTIKRIARSIMQIKHPLVGEIRVIIENEPVWCVLSRKEYKITEREIEGNLKWFVQRICFCNLPSMIEDVAQLGKTNEEKELTFFILMLKLIETGEFEKGLNALLKYNGPESVRKICERLFYHTESLVNDKNRKCELYINVLSDLYRAYKRNGGRPYYEQVLENIASVYYIYKDFRLNVKLSDLQHASLIDTLIDVAFDIESMSVKEIVAQIEKVARYLNQSYGTICIKVSSLISDLDVLVELGENLHDRFDVSSKNRCLFAVLILKNIGAVESNFDETFNTSFAGDCASVKSSSDFIGALKVAKRLTVQAICKVGQDDSVACMEVYKWINISEDLIANAERNLSVPHTINGIKAIFDVFCQYIGQFQVDNLKYLTYFNGSDSNLNQMELLNQTTNLSVVIEMMCREEQAMTAYTALAQLHTSLHYSPEPVSPTIKTKLDELKLKAKRSLLQVLLPKENFNSELFLAVLLSCATEEGQKLFTKSLREYKRQPEKFREICYVGLEYDQLHPSSFTEYLNDTISTVNWWLKIPNCCIGYDLFFKSTATSRLEMLIKFGYVNLAILRDYCHDFQLSDKLYYDLYLEKVLTNWKLCYEVKLDVDGHSYIVIEEMERDGLVEKCGEIIAAINEEKRIMKVMNDVWDKINPYYYEVFLCILHFRHQLGYADSSAQKKLLEFLQTYNRVNPPAEWESEQWFSTFSDTQSLDPLSKYRLPFSAKLMSHDIWNIIRPEVSLSTYKVWFKAVEILKNLNMNDICTLAVKDIVTSGVLKHTDDTWTLFPKHSDLFDAMDECAGYISDLKVCTSAIYFVLADTPSGADQVRAASICYKYAQDFLQKDPNNEDIQAAFKKVEAKYFKSSASFILHKYKIDGDERYAELLSQPKKLITAIYLDERILKVGNFVEDYCPSLNEAVNDLAILYNINIAKYRKELLKCWLSNSYTDDEMNSAVSDSLIGQLQDVEANLTRAIYVCTSDIPYYRDHLLKLGSIENDIVNEKYEFLANCMKCFCALTDAETCATISNTPYEAVLNYTDKLTLLGELEQLGIEMNVSSLDSYNKKSLFKRLAGISKNVVAVQAMASICMTYKFDAVKYWKYTIERAMDLKMIKKLKVYMEHLYKFNAQPFYINAWQMIIDDAFFTATSSILGRNEKRDLFVETFWMMQNCPVLHLLQFETIFKGLIQTKLYSYAAVLLQYLPSVAEDFVQEISAAPRLSADLNELHQYGVRGIQKLAVFP